MKKIKPFKITRRVFGYPYVLFMLLFIILPLVLILVNAFLDPDGYLTLENFKTFFTERSSLIVLGNSVLVGIITTLICLLIGYPISYWMAKEGPQFQKAAMALIMLPMWMNFLLRTYAWMGLLSINGPVNAVLGVFGLGPFNMLNTSGAVVLGMVYNYVPYMILPLYTSMTKIDQSLVEAAQDLGASTTKTLLRVLIPMSVPGISTGITMVFVPAVSTFVISRMLGGGSNLLIGDLIEMQFLGNSYNLNVGSAMSLVLMIIVLLCMSFTSSFDEDEMEGVS